MEPEAVEIAQEAQDLALTIWDHGQVFLNGLMRPWNAYQIGIVAATFFVAYCIARFIGPQSPFLPCYCRFSAASPAGSPG